MSYYRPSQTVAMSRGGRGFSSSYRGGSGGRSTWIPPPDRDRSMYGPSRGSGGRFPSFSSSMDSRPKYPMGSSDRYSGPRGDYDDYHHKSYRSDPTGGSGYSGRDRSPDRKRLRPEAPSSRRSHEADNFNSSSSRYQSNSFASRSFSRDRRPPSFSSRRDDFRKPSGPPLSTSSPRGGYRGRISSRGVRGSRMRDGVRRRLVESSYIIRRRMAARVSAEYSRKLRLNRIRSVIARRVSLRKRRESDDKEESGDEKPKLTDEEAKPETDKPENEQKGEATGEEKKESPRKSPKKEAEGEKESKTANEMEEKSPYRREFIKLKCPHCNTKCITFGKYSLHLHSSRHMAAMRHVAMKQKSVLGRMRLAQRNAQRELEKNTDDLAPRTNFCPLCKLNYKQAKITHQVSDSHKNMKKFLMPYCRTCRITFKSPMLYETHVCSLEHIKRKSRADINGEKSEREDSGNDEELENFMTIDSVGDVDDDETGKKKDAESKSKEKINVGIEKIKKIEVYYCELCRMYLPRVDEGEVEKTLSKHCKQRIHMQRYIRYKEDKEIASRAERLQRKETAEKERERTKIKEEAKEGVNKEAAAKDDNDATKAEENEQAPNGNGDEEETNDDKLWAEDVNKDIGDLLAEAESGNKSSDDEGGERYDRFGCSKKNGEDKEAENEDKTEGVKNDAGENKVENK